MILVLSYSYPLPTKVITYLQSLGPWRFSHDGQFRVKVSHRLVAKRTRNIVCFSDVRPLLYHAS